MDEMTTSQLVKKIKKELKALQEEAERISRNQDSLCDWTLNHLANDIAELIAKYSRC